MSKRIFSNKGITLIELLTVLGLLSIMVIASVSIYIFSHKTFSAGNDQYNVQARARLTSETIINQIRFATDVTLIDSAVEEDDLYILENFGYKFIYLDDGFIKFTQVDYVGGKNTELLLKVPDDMTIGMIFKKKSDDILEVELLAENDKLFDIVNQVQILNIHLQTEEIFGSESFIVGSAGEAVKFISPVRYINAEAPFSLVSYGKSAQNYLVVVDRPESVYSYEGLSGAPSLTISQDQTFADGTATQLIISKPSSLPSDYRFTISTPDTAATIKFILRFTSNSNWSLEEVTNFE